MTFIINRNHICIHMTLRCYKYFEKLFKNSLPYRSEISCIQAFFALRNNKKLYQQYKIKPLLLTTLIQSDTRERETPKWVTESNSPSYSPYLGPPEGLVPPNLKGNSATQAP